MGTTHDTTTETVTIEIGRLCTRGPDKGHVWTYHQPEPYCQNNTWPVYVNIPADQLDRLPDWLKDLAGGRRQPG